MFVIAYLAGMNPVLIDHNGRKMYYLPTAIHDYPVYYTEISDEEIARYLYEYTYRYDKNELIRYEE